MAKDNKSKRDTVQSPQELKTTERRFGELIEDMIQLMTRIYRNQVLEELHKSTIKKFADAQKGQPGNYARVLDRLANRAKRKLIDRFDDNRIERMVRKYYNDTNKRNANKLYGELSKKLGISSQRLLKKEGLTFQNNALIREAIRWVEKLRDDTLAEFTSNTIRKMALGKSVDDIISEYTNLAEKKRSKARFIAQQQINTYNSMLTKMRSQKVGITKAIWVTARDERVRECHRVRDGKEFDLDKGLYSSCDSETLYPGTDYRCRCTYKLIIPDEDESE
jgi:SPP1 gp7 family putative phage head morphogenesis protein